MGTLPSLVLCISIVFVVVLFLFVGFCNNPLLLQKEVSLTRGENSTYLYIPVYKEKYLFTRCE